MYGDCSPVQELIELLDHYKQFHLYIDDAHGMSSFGKNGTGYVLSKVDLHPKMILATAMGKAFGTIGGIFVIPDENLRAKVRNCAGPLIFSSQQAIPVLAASIASAKIHLSGEINVRQVFLAEKISYCHRLLKEYNLPDISAPDTPVFFIALGLIKVAYNLVKKMIDEGYFVNLAVFPAVPETCSGMRFTITLHHSLEDIENMIRALANHFPKVLEEEKQSIKDIQRAFKKVADLETIVLKTDELKPVKQPYRVQHETTIEKIPQELWKKLFGNDVSFNWKGLKFMEETFKDNPKQENNWSFHYYIVWNQKQEPVLATFFTVRTIKDDMLSPIAISKQIETKRIDDPYYLTSKGMIMGSLLAEGHYLYTDRSNPNWQDALLLLLDHVRDEQEREGANILLLRDFDAEDTVIKDLLADESFIKTILPDMHRIENMNWKSEEEFLNQLNHPKRQYIKYKVLKYESFYDVVILSGNNKVGNFASWQNLCENVREKSFEINSFNLPQKFFDNMSKHPDWEVIELQLKPQYSQQAKNMPVAVMLCFKTPTCYFPILVGIDYNYLETHNVYPQILWQAVKRARHLNVKTIQLGLTASQNKRKFGATAISQVAYIQMKDNYNIALIDLMTNKE